MIIGLTHEGGTKTFVNSAHIVSFSERDNKIHPPRKTVPLPWVTVVHMIAGPTPLFATYPPADVLVGLLDPEPDYYT